LRYALLTTASVCFGLGALSTIARAEPADVSVDRCVGANTAAQSLRREGKLGAARAELAVCVDAKCPALVRDDCTQRLDELERAQPTIVLEAKDNQGHDVSEATVEVDGRPFTQRLDGIAMAVEPGEHTFTFEVKGFPKLAQKFVLREGEKGRREQILLGGALQPAAMGGTSLRSSPVDATPLGVQRVASLVALGAGLVGAAAGVAFAVEAKAKANDADAYCPRTVCANDAALRMNQDARVAGNLATGAFVVGAAGIAGAVVLWLTAKPSPSSPTAEVALVGGTLRVQGTW